MLDLQAAQGTVAASFEYSRWPMASIRADGFFLLTLVWGVLDPIIGELLFMFDSGSYI